MTYNTLQIRELALRHVDEDELCEMAQETMLDMGNAGLCIECGADADGCEPDARAYRCEDCGKPAVFGLEELVLCMVA